MTLKELREFIDGSGKPDNALVLFHRFGNGPDTKCVLTPLEFAGNTDCQEDLGFSKEQVFILYCN